MSPAGLQSHVPGTAEHAEAHPGPTQPHVVQSELAVGGAGRCLRLHVAPPSTCTMLMDWGLGWRLGTTSCHLMLSPDVVVCAAATGDTHAHSTKAGAALDKASGCSAHAHLLASRSGMQHLACRRAGELHNWIGCSLHECKTVATPPFLICQVRQQRLSRQCRSTMHRPACRLAALPPCRPTCLHHRHPMLPAGLAEEQGGSASQQGVQCQAWGDGDARWHAGWHAHHHRHRLRHHHVGSRTAAVAEERCWCWCSRCHGRWHPHKKPPACFVLTV